MKIKKIFALALAMIMVFATVAVFAGSDEVKTVRQVHGLIKDIKLIDIYTATLNVKGEGSQEVYYILCNGLDPLETDMSEPRSIANAITIMLSGEDNDYVEAVVSTIMDEAQIPKDSKLVFAGFSMGGMVVQQAIADKRLKDNYEILYTLSIGAPYILTSEEKEGRLIRCADNLDPVPFMSIPLLANPFIGELQTETSFKFGLVHFRSYSEGTCWDKYDALGVYKGKTKTGSTISDLNLVYTYSE